MEKCTNKTLEQLKNLFNACLSAGYFPNVFKEAIIKFIPKKDKAVTNPVNYRPISLLEVLGKIFERIIQVRLNTFLSEHNILKEREHSLRTYKGTSTAITTTYKPIANALADQRQLLWFSGMSQKPLIRYGITA